MKRQSVAPISSLPNLHGERLRAVLTRDAAYVAGIPQLVAEPRVIQVTPCPDSGNVLFTREVYPNNLVSGAPDELATEIQLILYRARRRRFSVVFQYKPQPGERPRIGAIFWWVGGERASVSLHLSAVDSKERVVLPLWIDTVAERTQVLKLDLPKNASLFHLPSPTKPFALIVVTSGTGATYRVNTDGSTQLIRKDGLINGFQPDGESCVIAKESASGDTTYSLFHVPSGSEKTLPPAEGEKLQQRTLPQDTLGRSLAAALPLKLESRVSKGELAVPMLYLAPQNQSGEETLLLADAEPACICQDLQTVFYYQQGLLYLLPIQKMPLGPFLKERDTAQQQLTIRRAVTLWRTVLMEYFSRNEQSWPKPGTDIDTLFNHQPHDLLLTQNPRTNRDDLRFEWNGSDPQSATTRVLSLGGPGGRAVVFGDGHVVWESERR